MHRFTLRRATCALALSAALLVPAAASAATKAPSGAIGWWQRFVHLLGAAGCIIDPHGACMPSPSGTAPAGCIMDPHGACLKSPSGTAPAANVDAGCGLDPHGLCSPSH